MTYFHASFMFVVVFQQNYGCRIFECLNPTGEIPPGCAALIYWQFAPLEARTYMVSPNMYLLCFSKNSLNSFLSSVSLERSHFH